MVYEKDEGDCGKGCDEDLQTELQEHIGRYIQGETTGPGRNWQTHSILVKQFTENISFIINTEAIKCNHFE